jgi:hypothetical protein
VPYLPYQEAKQFYGSELTEDECQSIWTTSADEVAVLAPAPEEVPDDYALRARQAEKMLGAWLVAGGHLYDIFGSPTSQIATTLKTQTAADIVRRYMGRYYNSGRGVRIRDIQRG